jgi:hypothetical protein
MGHRASTRYLPDYYPVLTRSFWHHRHVMGNHRPRQNGQLHSRQSQSSHTAQARLPPQPHTIEYTIPITRYS